MFLWLVRIIILQSIFTQGEIWAEGCIHRKIERTIRVHRDFCLCYRHNTNRAIWRIDFDVVAYSLRTDIFNVLLDIEMHKACCFKCRINHLGHFRIECAIGPDIIRTICKQCTAVILDLDHLGVSPDTGSCSGVVLAPVDDRPVAKDLDTSSFGLFKTTLLKVDTDRSTSIVEDSWLDGIGNTAIVDFNITRPDDVIGRIVMIFIVDIEWIEIDHPDPLRT